MNSQLIIDGKSPKIPTLEGSVKQIAWAQDIRSKFIEWANKQPDMRVVGAAESVRLMKSAKFWIEYRSDFNFIRSFCTEQDPEFDINSNSVGGEICIFKDPIAQDNFEKHLDGLPKIITE